MVGWHHRLNGHESEQAPRVGDGQGAWGAAVHGVTKSQLNTVYHIFFICDGHFGCFHILSILNNAAVNIWVFFFFKLVFLFSLVYTNEWNC